MLKEKTKDIELSGKKYRLNKMDARTGSYVAAKMAIVCAPLLGGDGITEESIKKVLPSLTRRDFDELQTILLKTVYRYADNGMVEPICKGESGIIFDEELAYDVQTVIALTVHAIMFNVGGFFNEAGLMNPAKI